MAMKKNRGDNRSTEMTSMIDVIFLLLIFFLVTLATGTQEPSPAGATISEEEAALLDLPKAQGMVVSDSLNNFILLYAIEEEDNNRYRTYLLDDKISSLDEIVAMQEEYEGYVKASSLTMEQQGRKNLLEQELKKRIFDVPKKGTAGFNSNYETVVNRLQAAIQSKIYDPTSKPELHLKFPPSIPYKFFYSVVKICNQENIRLDYMHFRVLSMAK